MKRVFVQVIYLIYKVPFIEPIQIMNRRTFKCNIHLMYKEEILPRKVKVIPKVKESKDLRRSTGRQSQAGGVLNVSTYAVYG